MAVMLRTLQVYSNMTTALDSKQMLLQVLITNYVYTVMLRI